MPALANQPVSPKQIADELRSHVIGQEIAVRETAIALSMRLSGCRAGNVLLIGPSGCGKTTLMKAAEAVLNGLVEDGHPLVMIRIHANVLGQAAQAGHSGQVVLRMLLERAREQMPSADISTVVEAALSGVVFVDEVDKIRSRIASEPNVSGVRSQEALLTLMENESVTFEAPRWMSAEGLDGLSVDPSAPGTLQLDSRRVLFVCAGAFEGLYDAVYDRVTVGADRGALQPVTIVEDGEVTQELPFKLSDWLRSEDLFDYGMSPQFLARFDATVLLESLGQADLVRVLLELDDSPLVEARQFFAVFGVDLALSPAAIEAVVAAAVARPRMGARALREVLRRVLRERQFDPSAIVDRVLFIDREDVDAALSR